MNQKGAVPLLILVAAIGIIGVLTVASLSPFKNSLLSAFFPKNSSFAASTPTTASFGNMNLSTTFNSIGVEVFFSGNTSATAKLEFKKASESNFRPGIDLWATNDGSTTPGPAFYGSAMLLEAGTPYDIKVTLNDPGQTPASQVLTGNITTRAENIPSANSLAPTHFVRADGADTNPGTSDSPTGAWKTLQKAVTALNAMTAPVSPIIQVGPGSFKNPTTLINRSMTFKAQYPALDNQRNVINQGNHSIIDPTVVSCPTSDTSCSQNKGVWQEVTITGSTTNEPRKIWRWNNTAARSGLKAPATLSYANSLNDLPERIVAWKLMNKSATDTTGTTWTDSTVEGWVDMLHANLTYNYGWRTFVNTSNTTITTDDTLDLYLRIPDNLDPNTLYMRAGPIPIDSSGNGMAGFSINSSNTRITGFKFLQTGIKASSLGNFGIYDHNLIQLGNIELNGKKASATSPVEYPTDNVVEYNKFIDTNLWSEDPTNDPAIPWNFIKGGVTLPGTFSAALPWGRPGESSETTAGRGQGKRTVWRHNTIDGFFNGIGAYNTGFDRYATQDVDAHDNLFDNIPDDAFEPEQFGINWRIWNNKLKDGAVFLSTGPVSYGPAYVFRNQIFQISNEGVGRDASGQVTIGGNAFKYSRSANPRSRIYLINNTFWSNYLDISNGGSSAAGGSGGGEMFYLRNNIFRMTRYAFDAPGNSPGVDAWNEDYNHFYTSDASRGIAVANLKLPTIESYRSNSNQGAHTNLAGDFTTPIDSQVTITPDSMSLPSNSVFIDKGIVVPNITETFSGSAPDVGACEGTNCLASTGVADPPAVSPIPDASSEGKVGDIDGNGKVDIFDYNLLLTDFGNKTGPITKADLDNDDDVDIFDYNILLTNFGK